jgi:ribulose-phosphate 3-epimerase
MKFRKIVPAILESSTDENYRISEVKRKVGLVSNLVKRVQIDIIDGKFANNLTEMPEKLKEVDFSGVAVDIHLMVVEPINYLSRCEVLAKKGYDLRALAQVERMSDIKAYVFETLKKKIDAGLALDLDTSIELIPQELFSQVECVLLMSVKAGFSGQKFSELVIEKISNLRKSGYRGEITMDGGMNPETIALSKNAGADTFGVTSYLWNNSRSVESVLQELEEVAK